MGRNFHDYPGFQPIPGMPILLQQSVHTRYVVNGSLNELLVIDLFLTL